MFLLSQMRGKLKRSLRSRMILLLLCLLYLLYGPESGLGTPSRTSGKPPSDTKLQPPFRYFIWYQGDVPIKSRLVQKLPSYLAQAYQKDDVNPTPTWLVSEDKSTAPVQGCKPGACDMVIITIDRTDDDYLQPTIDWHDGTAVARDADKSHEAPPPAILACPFTSGRVPDFDKNCREQILKDLCEAFKMHSSQHAHKAASGPVASFCESPHNPPQGAVANAKKVN